MKWAACPFSFLPREKKKTTFFLTTNKSGKTHDKQEDGGAPHIPLERHDQVQKQHLQGHRRTLVTPNNLAVTL